MKHWINTHYKSLIIAAFLIPIITVAIVSISHVTKWYGISNPVSWAIYLSIGVEIAALSALAAISADMGKKVYFPFAIVTLVQFIGNIFFAYSYIDISSKLFTDWVDLVSPLVSFMGVEPTDFVGHKRFLAFFPGGMLPVISLSFLHMLVKFTEEDRKNEIKINEEEQKHVIDENLIKEAFEKYKKEQEENKVEASDLVAEVSRIRLSDEDLKKLEEVLLNPPKPNQALKSAKTYYQEKVRETEERKINSITEPPIEEEISVVNDTPISREETTLEFKSRSEILSDMMQKDQELGLYDEPFDNPMIKNQEEDNDWGGLSNEELIGDDEIPSIIEPTIEEEEQNFSTIDSNNEIIFQDEVEPYQSQIDTINQMLSEVENETFSEEPTTLNSSVETQISSDEDEKKN